MRQAITLALFTAVFAGRPAGAAEGGPNARLGARKPEPLPTPTQVLEWLPPDTETLVVCKGPYTVEASQPDGKKEAALPLEHHLQRLSYAPLTCIGDGACLKPLDGQEVALAVEGSRQFRPAKGLGMFPYEGCHILVFRRPLGPVGADLRKALTRDAKRVEKLAGQDVFVFQTKLENDLWTFFVAQPRSDVLLCATHAGYLETVLRRMAGKAGKGGRRAFPEDLAEWRLVDRDAHFWAIRHFARKDPARGQELTQADHSALSLDATGFTFAYDPGRGPAKVKWLSNAKDAARDLEEAWTYVGERTWKPTVKHGIPGVIEMTAELKDEEDAGRLLYILLCHLGHIINC
jgi:hypothetical protein